MGDLYFDEILDIKKESNLDNQIYHIRNKDLEKENLFGITSFKKRNLIENFRNDDKKIYINKEISDHERELIIRKILEGIRLEPRERVHVITAEEFYRANSHKFDQRAKETANVVREVKYIKVILNFVFKNRRKFDIEILDAGCGNGRISLPLIEEGYLVYGVDIFEDFINQLLVKVKNEKKSMTDFMRGIYYRPENFFLKGNILDLPFDNNKFDCILLMWHVVVEVSDYLDELFKHLYTKLKVGGIIVFDIPDKNDQTTQVAYQESENSKANYEAYLARAPEAREIINSLKKHRFESVRTKERFKKTFRIGVRKHVFIARKKGFAGTVFRIKDLI